jgi:nucleotide-binding universal stress UspA family protein
MSTHGASAARLLGSVIDRVLRTASNAVLVFRAA